MKNCLLHVLLTVVAIFCLPHTSLAQPQVEWFKTFGGSESDIGQAVAQTDDGGFVAVGGTMSDDEDVEGNHGPGRDDWWVVKVDGNGFFQWQKCFGTVSSERAHDVQPTPDNGCIVTGYIDDDGSNDQHNGISDYWVVKLDSVGEVEWDRVYGISGSETAYTLSLTADGGYILAGNRGIFKLDVIWDM